MTPMYGSVAALFSYDARKQRLFATAFKGGVHQESMPRFGFQGQLKQLKRVGAPMVLSADAVGLGLNAQVMVVTCQTELLTQGSMGVRTNIVAGYSRTSRGCCSRCQVRGREASREAGGGGSEATAALIG
jgi:hypothetical protein